MFGWVSKQKKTAPAHNKKKLNDMSLGCGVKSNSGHGHPDSQGCWEAAMSRSGTGMLVVSARWWRMRGEDAKQLRSSRRASGLHSVVGQRVLSCYSTHDEASCSQPLLWADPSARDVSNPWMPARFRGSFRDSAQGNVSSSVQSLSSPTSRQLQDAFPSPWESNRPKKPNMPTRWKAHPTSTRGTTEAMAHTVSF